LKKIIYILFFIAIAFSISTSFVVLNKRHYIPRNHLLKNLKDAPFLRLQKRSINTQQLNVQFKLYGSIYELVFQENKGYFNIWLKTKNGESTDEYYTNLKSLIKHHKNPIRNNNSECFENFYESLFLNAIDFHINALHTTSDKMIISSNCSFNTIIVEPHSPPPKMA